MIPGFETRVTKGGIPVIRIHYSADPAKRPGTPDGDKWIADELKGYPGGSLSSRWRKEMEIDYGAMGGTKVFPKWEEWATSGKIVVRPFDPIGYKLYGSYDHGWRRPSAYHVHGINGDGEIVTLWEFYGERVTVNEIAKIILGQAVSTSDGRRFPGNPYAGQETFRVADPQIWAEDQQMSDNPMKSISYLFEQMKIYFEPGDRGGDVTVAEWLYGHFWADPTQPLYRITTACPKLIWEIGKLRYREYSPRVAVNREQPESLVDKDDHAWDSLKLFLKRFPPTPKELAEKKQPGNFQWWRKQAINAKNGMAAQTYRREMVE